MDAALSQHDPDNRYAGSFDTRDFKALSHRRITCHFANALCVVRDSQGVVWWWWWQASAWARFSSNIDHAILAENASWLRTLRRAIPIIRLYTTTPVLGEKEAAYQALQRLAESVATDFRQATWFSVDSEDTYRPSVSCLYSAALRDDLWQMPDVSPPPYEEAVYLHFLDRQVAEAP